VGAKVGELYEDHGRGDGGRTVSGSWAEAMVGELYEDHGRGRCWENCVRIVGVGDGGRTV
jgi:hypothetical protein